MTSPELAGRWYDELLAPAFPADELPVRDEVVGGIADGSILVHVLADPGQPDGPADGVPEHPVGPAVSAPEHPIGIALGRFHRPSGVLLLEFLAVRQGLRGQGVGARLLDEALAAWQQEFRPSLVVGELEHPWLRPADDAHGDPVARLRFYHRAGARALPVAYVLPPMRPGGATVPLVLVVLRDEGRLPGAHVAADGLYRFLLHRFPHDGEPYAQAIIDASAAELPTVALDAPVADLPNPPRRA